MQCCSLATSDFTSITSHITTVSYFHFGSIPSFFLELFLHWSPVAYWAHTDLGSSSFSVLSFCLFMGFSSQEYWSGLPFPSPVDHVLSKLSTMTHPSLVVLYDMAHSFIGLDKAVVHVLSLISFLWLWFSFCLAIATHFSTLAWKMPWAEEPGRLQSMESLRVRHDWVTHFHSSLSCIGEGNGNPLQCSCLENPRDGGAWWAAIYGVAQSQTWLKRLSSSSSPLIRIKGLWKLPDERDWPWGKLGLVQVFLPGEFHGQRSLVGYSL